MSADPVAPPPPVVPTVQIRGQDGKIADIPADQAFDALKSGAEVINGQEIPVTVGGQTRWVPVEKAQEFSETFATDSAERTAVAESVYGGRTGEASLVGFGAGLIDSVTAGTLPTSARELISQVRSGAPQLPPSIQALRGDDPVRVAYEQAVRERQERASADWARGVHQQNLTASSGAEISGGIAGSLAVNSLTGGLGGLTTRAGVAGRLAGAALEGSLGSIGAAKEDHFIRNAEFDSSALWHAAGTGALLGLGIGSAFEGAGALWRAARGGTQVAEALAEEAASRAPGALKLTSRSGIRGAQEAAEGSAQGAARGAAAAGDDAAAAFAEALRAGQKGTVAQKIEEQVAKGARSLGVSEEAIEGLVSGAESAANRAALRTAKKEAETTARQMVDGVKEMTLLDDFLGNFNKSRDALMSSIQDPALAQVQRQATRTVVSDAASTADAILERATLTGEKRLIDVAKRYQQAIQDNGAIVAAERGQGEVYAALQNLKRAQQHAVQDMNNIANWAQKEAIAPIKQEAADFSRIMQEAAESSRQFMTNEQVWGKSAAEAQRGINSAYEDLLDRFASFKRHLVTESEHGVAYETGRRIADADSAKIASFANGIGKVSNINAEEALEQTLLGYKKLLSEAEKIGMPLESTATTRSAVDKIEAAYLGAKKAAKLQGWREEILTAEAGSFGAAKAVESAGGWGRTVGAAMSPNNQLQLLAAAEHAAATQRGLIGQAARLVLGGKAGASTTITAAAAARDAAFGAVKGVSPELSKSAKAAAIHGGIRASYWAGAQSRQEAYQRRAREVQALAAPGEAERRATATLGGFRGAAPQLTSQMAQRARSAADFLASKMPAPTARAGLQGDRKLPQITQQQAEKFGRYWTATTHPMDCVGLLSRGELRTEHVEALKAVHPAIYQELRTSVLRAVESSPDPIPPNRARQLDILLGLQGEADPSVKPSSLQVMARIGQQQQGQQRPGGPPSQAAKRAQTRSEQLM